jgi:hypothetical protein
MAVKFDITTTEAWKKEMHDFCECVTSIVEDAFPNNFISSITMTPGPVPSEGAEFWHVHVMVKFNQEAFGSLITTLAPVPVELSSHRYQHAIGLIKEINTCSMQACRKLINDAYSGMYDLTKSAQEALNKFVKLIEYS